MAIAGRKPKPTALSRGKRAINRNEPQPNKLHVRTANLIGAELLIGAEAKRIWERLYRPLVDCRLATEADAFALLELAESIGEMRESRLQLLDLNAVIEGLSGGKDLGGGASLVDETAMAQLNALERKRAALKLDIKWAYERVRDLMNGMGCTPAARSKIQLDDAQSDMFADAMRMIDVTFHDGDDAGAVSEEGARAV